MYAVKKKKNNNNNKKRRLSGDVMLRKEEEEDAYEVPSDIWWEILSRLPLESRKGARLVCRVWNTILTLTLHHHPTLTPASLLYSVHGVNYSSYKFPYLTLAHPPNARDLPPTVMYLPDPCTPVPPIHKLLQPIASCHGLVCFLSPVNKQDPIFVGNPLLREELLMVPGSDTTKTHIRTAYVSELIVGFGFSPKTNRYKIMQFVIISKEPHRGRQEYFNVCTLCSTNHDESPLWRSILNFPRQFRQGIKGKPVGSYLKGGIHWLLWDEDGGSVFISRLDLDTEQFGRVQAPQTSDFNTADKCLEDMCLGVSDGYLNICANLRSEEVDVWVMKEHYSWTKQFVVANPSTILPRYLLRIEILNYAAVEAATRRGEVAEVMLLFAKVFLVACTTKGGHSRVLLPDAPLPRYAIVHIPSFLSIKDATKM